MQQRVKEDIVSALNEAYNAFERFDIAKLNRVSNFTIHNAGIFQDHDSITFAVLIYALAKVCERERERDYANWKAFTEKTLEILREARKSLAAGKYPLYQKDVKHLFRIIGLLDKKLTKYATEVAEQAKVKKGGKVYEHGISAGRVAELMGISEWELLSYVGEAGIAERIGQTVSVEQRLKNARRIFRVK